MFVEPEGWSIVERRNKKELTNLERYEWAQEQDLYYANKGIGIVN